ncbi:hypothetical protein FACS1894139_07810 [Planctomycetales bacterium]|nr:hypothetical protein FACS1894107_09310 [Planctomycetales bacterium]GHS99243.1 hypothetical protein FACS1894108_08850 [Planctomycetales bacterium]GHT04897.1 hypothetical protein FACS1894139_07810 [Planctomycetales bacterium]
MVNKRLAEMTLCVERMNEFSLNADGAFYRDNSYAPAAYVAGLDAENKGKQKFTQCAGATAKEAMGKLLNDEKANGEAKREGVELDKLDTVGDGVLDRKQSVEGVMSSYDIDDRLRGLFSRAKNFLGEEVAPGERSPESVAKELDKVESPQEAKVAIEAQSTAKEIREWVGQKERGATVDAGRSLTAQNPDF